MDRGDQDEMLQHMNNVAGRQSSKTGERKQIVISRKLRVPKSGGPCDRSGRDLSGPVKKYLFSYLHKQERFPQAYSLQA